MYLAEINWAFITFHEYHISFDSVLRNIWDIIHYVHLNPHVLRYLAIFFRNVEKWMTHFIWKPRRRVDKHQRTIFYSSLCLKISFCQTIIFLQRLKIVAQKIWFFPQVNVLSPLVLCNVAVGYAQCILPSCMIPFNDVICLCCITRFVSDTDSASQALKSGNVDLSHREGTRL